MDEVWQPKIEEFLRRHPDTRMGPPISEQELRDLLREDNAEVTYESLPEDYREFLHLYGPLRKDAIRIGDDFQYLIADQDEFRAACMGDGMRDTQTKTLWQVADLDVDPTSGDATDFYLNVSRPGRPKYYKWPHPGRHRMYARCFAEFLDNIFKEFEYLGCNGSTTDPEDHGAGHAVEEPMDDEELDEEEEEGEGEEDNGARQ